MHCRGQAEVLHVPLGPEFSVYIKGIDSQHRYLVTVLNNLYIGILAGEEKKVVGETLNSLVDYTKFHFRSEERLFDRRRIRVSPCGEPSPPA